MVFAHLCHILCIFIFFMLICSPLLQSFACIFAKEDTFKLRLMCRGTVLLKRGGQINDFILVML